MKNNVIKLFSAALFSVALLAPSANAAIITSTLGNDTIFTDGDLLSISDFFGVTPFPFDTNNDGIESNTGSNFSSTWTHNFGAITDSILSATFTVGIFDHDSASIGDQLGLLDLDTIDLTSTLNGLFEGSGGAQNQYNVYTFNLSAGVLAQLFDGNLAVKMDLIGPVFSPAPLPILMDAIFDFNSAELVFSTLNITTQATNPPTPNPVPEPGALSLLLVGLAVLYVRKTKDI
jgi:hypothetical protein